MEKTIKTEENVIINIKMEENIKIEKDILEVEIDTNIKVEESEVLIVDSSAVIQRRIKNLLYSDTYCALCFEEPTELHSIHSQIEIIGDFGIRNIILKDAISYLLRNKSESMKPHICTKCLNQIYNCYLFICNSDYNSRIMNEYIEQIKFKACEVKDIGNLDKVCLALKHEEIAELNNPNRNILVTGGFKCLKCNKDMDSFEDLKLHETSHKWNHKVVCRVCKQSIYRNGYRAHIKMNHSEKAMYCKYCDAAFLNKRSYKCHIKRHETRPDFRLKDLGNIKLQEQCGLCLQHLDKLSLKTHKCHYSCIDCDILHCIHYKYLLACRKQIVNHIKIKCPEVACEYKCKKRQQLIGHLNRDHLDFHPFTCDVCKQEFYSKEPMKNHISMYHQEIYTCVYCCKDFNKQRDTFKSHLDMCKDIRREFKCDSCPASFDSKEALIDHELKCLKYHCTSCNWKFNKESKLSEHLSKVHSGVQIVTVSKFNKTPKHIRKVSDKIYTCDICGTQCTSNKALVCHKKSHIKVECTECGKTYTKSTIRAHIICKHKEQPELTCEFCGDVFKSKSKFEFHVQRHTEQVKCPECSKYVHQGRMPRHMQYHNRKKRDIRNNKQSGFGCSQCEYKAHSSVFLEGHINQVHLKIRPYKCEQCGKDFGGKEDLKKHMESHTRHREKVCEICHAMLINKRSYDKHMALHTGIKPHKCNQCTDGFHSLGELNNHKILKHSGKCIACPMPNCESKFAVLPHLRVHFKKVHWKRKDKPFNPKELKGLHERYYYMFEDKRRRQLV